MNITSRHLIETVLLLGLGLASAALAKPPNIILILTDDQGWNNTEMPMIRHAPTPVPTFTSRRISSASPMSG